MLCCTGTNKSLLQALCQVCATNYTLSDVMLLDVALTLFSRNHAACMPKGYKRQPHSPLDTVLLSVASTVSNTAALQVYALLFVT